MTSDRCVFCGGSAIRGHDGTIIGWAVQWGLNGAGAHEHETIEGEQ